MLNRLKHSIIIALMLFFVGDGLFATSLHVVYLDDTLKLEAPAGLRIVFNEKPSDESISRFYESLNASDYRVLVDQLIDYKEKHQLNDWLFYQLVRKTAEQLSPKSSNYNSYTLYKWFLLAKCGYDATVSFGAKSLLFYVKSEDSIYGIPYFERDHQQYICLNYHDYGQINFNKEQVVATTVVVPEGVKPFSYKITLMPDFKPADYITKDLKFDYKDRAFHFKVKLNPEVKNLFNNYPVSDFGTYFNIPLSKETHSSLIPELKQHTDQLSQQDGVDFLMRFTRYAFLYENDLDHFGKEKRLSPEQTLLYEHSDCDDRAALFFYLVKEIFDLPMIAMLYPTHVTIAIHFDQPVGKPIYYQGKPYSVCDPTPQEQDTQIGQIASQLKHASYEVVYAYDPLKVK